MRYYRYTTSPTWLMVFIISFLPWKGPVQMADGTILNILTW